MTGVMKIILPKADGQMFSLEDKVIYVRDNYLEHWKVTGVTKHPVEYKYNIQKDNLTLYNIPQSRLDPSWDFVPLSEEAQELGVAMQTIKGEAFRLMFGGG